ncbi:MAG: hydroxyacylglutathione hydrolase [Chloroflexi bacterium]|nr:MAG: hydroxyacylglutathione hydrolase [Chloroflexota bacterium]
MIKSREAIVIDVRDPSEFATGHIEGSISLPFSEKGINERLSALINQGTKVVILASASQQSESASQQLSDGTFQVVDIIDDIDIALSKLEATALVTPEVSLDDLTGSNRDTSMLVLDVREPIEWEMGHVPGALLISLGTLRDHINEIPSHNKIAVICEAGLRSSTAASILESSGFTNVANVPDGTGGYRNAGLPLEYYSDE